MKVLHIVPYLPKASGVTTFVVEISDALQRSGNDNAIAVKDWDHFDVAASAAGVLRVRMDDVAARLMDYDVIHMHGIWPPFMHGIVKECKRRNKPIIWSLHGMLAPWAMRHKWWKKRLAWALWQKHDLRAAAVLHVTSEREREWVEACGFKNRIENVPLGTNLSEMVPLRRHEAKTLLFVGRVNPVKGLENLIRAWQVVQSEEWKLRIVGTDVANYSGTLISLVRSLALETSIEFPGPKYDDALDEEYRNADALILPSFTENFGGVVVDALAWGLPVITSKGTPWREVEAIRCGWWVENDSESLAKALRALISLSDVERVEMGARGRELVRSKYSWNAVAVRMKTVYESLLETDATGRMPVVSNYAKI